MADHEDCPRELIDGMAALGSEVTVSTEPPLVEGPYTTEAFICPHKVRFWIEPTGEQIARWVKDGVE